MNHMNVMKTSLVIFPCVLESTFLYIRVCPCLSFATKRIGPPRCTLFTFVTCRSLQIILSQNYLLLLISVLAENTLLETAYHFLLLLVGFNTLTYRKDYDRSPILVGHAALDFLLLPVELSGMSSMGAQHSKEARLPEWVQEVLPEEVSPEGALPAEAEVLPSGLQRQEQVPWRQLPPLPPGKVGRRR